MQFSCQNRHFPLKIFRSIQSQKWSGFDLMSEDPFRSFPSPVVQKQKPFRWPIHIGFMIPGLNNLSLTLA
jgi:hypothetical protein